MSLLRSEEQTRVAHTTGKMITFAAEEYNHRLHGLHRYRKSSYDGASSIHSSKGEYMETHNPPPICALRAICGFNCVFQYDLR